MVADTVPEEHRGYASSHLGGFKLVGQIASAIAALVLGNVMYIFAGIALVNVICAFVTVVTIRHLPDREKVVERRSFVADYIEPFKSHDFRAVWLNRFVTAFAYGCVTGYALYFLQDMVKSYTLFGADLKTANGSAQVLALTISFFGIFGAVLSSKFADRVGRKSLLIVAAVILAVALFPIAFLRELTPIWFCIAAYGIGQGIYQSNDWAIASDVLPNPDRAATEMGAWQSSETSVQILVGLIMGPVIDGFNRVQFGSGYTAMVAVACALFLGSILAVRSIRSAR
jgi:MFS family permease